jgi:hypothetical protein
LAKLTVTCLSFKPLRRGTLRGFADIRIAELRLDIKDIAIHQKGESRWAALPARPMLDKNGAVIRDRQTGKIQYANIFEFDSRDVRDAFSHAVVAAVLALVPEAFDEPLGMTP